MHRHPSRICVAFVKKKKEEADFCLFSFRDAYKKNVFNIGNIDYNVCELRLVGMSIQSTVQGFSSQSSFFVCFFYR